MQNPPTSPNPNSSRDKENSHAKALGIPTSNRLPKIINYPLSIIHSASRKGSVLILVIVLLLLLAILGTAFLSASRGDRQVSAQIALNNQTDLAAKGIANMVAGIIVGDLADFNGFTHGQAKPNPLSTPTPMAITYPSHPFPNAAPQGTPYHSSYVGNWVATQYYYVGDIVSYPPYPSPSTTYWVSLNNSSTALPPMPPASLAAYSPSNLSWAPAAPPGTTSGFNGVAGGNQLWLADRIPTLSTAGQPVWPNISQQYIPGTGPVSVLFSQPFESPDGTAGPAIGAPPLQNMYPGFKALGNTGVLVPTLDPVAPPTPTTGSFIAADADGDGMADSLLFRIPGATFDNLTWYAGVRIVDNNSAVNVNTAMSRDFQYDLTNSALSIPDWWGLFPSSVGLQEMLGLTQLPANLTSYVFNNNTPSSTSAWDETGVSPPFGGATVPNQRADLAFITEGDELSQLLARRLENPALVPVSADITFPRFQTLPLSDSAALAYHLALVNPNVMQQTNPPTVSENTMQQYLFNGMPSTPYNGTATQTPLLWYTNNFAISTSLLPPKPGQPPRTLAPKNPRPFLVTRNPVGNYITPVYDPAFPAITNNAGALTAITTNVTQGEPLYTTPFGLTSPTPGTVDPLGDLMLPYGPTVNVNGTGVPQSSYNHYRGAWTSTPNPPYQLNDIVLDHGYTYVCLADSLSLGTQLPAPAGTPLAQTPFEPATLVPGQGILQNSQYWALQPYTQHPIKANVNTATFRELFRAFWSVMSGNPVRSTQTTIPGHFYTLPGGTTIGAPLCPFGDVFETATYDNNNPAHQFRNILRDPAAAGTTYLDPGNVAILRAAIASVNTLGLRDNTQNVISRTIGLTALVQGSPTPQTVHAHVYSNAPQPFITEVFADTYTGDASSDPEFGLATNSPEHRGPSRLLPPPPGFPFPNNQGYVAVELFNPYPMTLNLSNWQVALIDRSTAGSNYPNLAFTSGNTSPLYAFPVGTTLPPGGFIILENFDPNTIVSATNAYANYRPDMALPSNGDATLNSGTMVQDIPVQALSSVIATNGAELVILRPRRADGTFTSNTTDPNNLYIESTTPSGTPNLADLVPVDSYDFTGLSITAGSPFMWHYIRPKGGTTAAPPQLFKATFPGYYSAPPAGAGNSRQTLTVAGAVGSGGAATLAGQGAYTTGTFPPGSLGQPFPQNPIGTYSAWYSFFPNMPIQIYNVGIVYPSLGVTLGANIFSHFPNPVAYPNPSSTPPNEPTAYVGAGIQQQFPYGGFARNGDMLDIPFIGAYRITTLTQEPTPTTPAAYVAPTTFLELNSLPMDCSFADEGTLANAHEQIGRFCPEAAQPQTNSPPATDNYFWTRRLFDYLTVENNSDSYLPNFDPGFNESVDLAAPTTLLPMKYPTTAAQTGMNFPGFVQPSYPTQSFNADPTLTDQTTQDNVGVDGLININTASAQVLNMLPMIPGSGNAAQNFALATAIVADRTTNGPFASIYDLNRVVGFQNAQGTINLATPEVNGSGGILCPAPGTTANLFPTTTNLTIPLAPTVVGRNISEDYQSDFAEVTRISNLITTRSDTYTVYIVVEGWQNAVFPGQSANTQNPPLLKVIHRYAFIADRSAISGAPGSFTLKTLNVPND